MLLTLHGSYSFGSEKFSVSPFAIYKMQQAYFHFISGSYISTGKFFGAIAAYNTGGTTIGGILSAGAKIKNFRISYGFDFMKTWKIMSSQETMFSAVLPEKKDRKKLRVAHNPVKPPFSF